MRRIALLGLVAALAACGGGGGGSTASDDAAGLVPPSALAFVILNTDVSSSQLKSAQEVLGKFPIKDRLLAELKRSARRGGGPSLDALTRSAGPQVDLAILDVAGEIGSVGFAKPVDEKAFLRQLSSGGDPIVHATIGGWTVFSDKQALLDAVKKRTGGLGEQSGYKDALATLPGEAIARAYIAPAALDEAVSRSGLGRTLPLGTKRARWLAAALTSASGALKLELHARGLARNAKQASSDLARQIPSGSIVALSMVGAGNALGPDRGQALRRAQALLPFDVKAVVAALGTETIAYVRPGLPLPEVTVASKPKDVQASLQAVGSLLTTLAAPAKTSTTTVDGVVLKQVDLGTFSLYYGAFDGELVVTDSRNAVAELRAKGDKLVDDAAFDDARNAAGMPAVSEGFLFVNLKDAVPAAEGLAQFGNTTIPKELDENLRPLRTFLGYASREGDVQTYVAFLSTS